MEVVALDNILKTLQMLATSYDELKESVRTIRSDMRTLSEEGKRRDEDRKQFQSKILKFYLGSLDEGSNELDKKKSREFRVKNESGILINENVKKQDYFNQQYVGEKSTTEAVESNLPIPSPAVDFFFKSVNGKTSTSVWGPTLKSGCVRGKRLTFDDVVFQKTT
uniref:Uncharacterized protein n=1 Tax=Cannabis sativa TaxID=3483 RepID=A0A803PLI9_CANSA